MPERITLKDAQRECVFLNARAQSSIGMCNENANLLNARTQNSLGMRSEHAKFECQNAQFTRDAQR